MAFVNLRLRHLARQHPVFICNFCGTDLALFSHLVSPLPGPWILREINVRVGIVISRVENVEVQHEQQVRVVGFRTETIVCRHCRLYVGWNYLQVPDGSRLAPGMTHLLRGAVETWNGIVLRLHELAVNAPLFMCRRCWTAVAYEADITHRHLYPPNGEFRNFFVFRRVFNLARRNRYAILTDWNLFAVDLVCKDCNRYLGFELTGTDAFQNITGVAFVLARGLLMPWQSH